MIKKENASKRNPFKAEENSLSRSNVVKKQPKKIVFLVKMRLRKSRRKFLIESKCGWGKAEENSLSSQNTVEKSRRKFLIASKCGLRRMDVAKRPEINVRREKLREEKEKYSKRNSLNNKMREIKQNREKGTANAYACLDKWNIGTNVLNSKQKGLV